MLSGVPSRPKMERGREGRKENEKGKPSVGEGPIGRGLLPASPHTHLQKLSACRPLPAVCLSSIHPTDPPPSRSSNSQPPIPARKSFILGKSSKVFRQRYHILLLPISSHLSIALSVDRDRRTIEISLSTRCSSSSILPV
jgi:hypothetical protein